MVRLGWRPRDFWTATMTEVITVMDAWAEANGTKPRHEAPTRERLEELKRKYG